MKKSAGLVVPHAAIVYGIGEIVVEVVVEVGHGVTVVEIATVIQTGAVVAAAGDKCKVALVAALVAVGRFPVRCNSTAKFNGTESRSIMFYLLQSRLLVCTGSRTPSDTTRNR